MISLVLMQSGNTTDQALLRFLEVKGWIQVVMITGDRLETAVAIAEDAGLIKSEMTIS